MVDNIIPIRSEPEADERKPTLMEILEEEYAELLLDMRRARIEGARLQSGEKADNGADEGACGSAQSVMTIAERVRILSSAAEFLTKLDRIKPPEKPRSGISTILSEYRRDPAAGSGRTRRRRGSGE